MSKINDDKIIASFNMAMESGHPDPLGVIARGDVKTGLDFDGSYKGAVGTFGVDRLQATSIGFTDEELSYTGSNLEASVQVDMNNYRKSNEDVDEMYRKSNGGGNKSTERFMGRLSKKKAELSERMKFDENGFAISISERKKPVDLTIDGKNKEIKSGTDDENIIHSKDISIPTADDVIDKVESYEFRIEDKKKIDEMLQQLVGIIINEKPING